MAAPTVTPEPRSPRPPLFRHPWRVAIVVVTLLVVANLGIVLISGADTNSPSSTGLPSTIESLTPGNGEIIRPEDTIGVDLRDDLTGVLVVDRAEIPEDQLERVVPLGQIAFRPGPAKDVTKWGTGKHTLTVLYWPQGKSRPAHPASYTWTFRVSA